MANYNKVILMGNLTRDPQLSYLPNQTPVVELGLAVNRRWKGQDGQQKEETTFVDCRAYGKQAEVLNQYMSKGRPILLEGRLQFSQWEDKQGNKRSKLRVVVENFQFLGSGGGDNAGGGGGGGYRRQQNSQTPAPQQGGGYGGSQVSAPEDGFSDQEPPPPDMGGDNIPF